MSARELRLRLLGVVESSKGVNRMPAMLESLQSLCRQSLRVTPAATMKSDFCCGIRFKSSGQDNMTHLSGEPCHSDYLDRQGLAASPATMERQKSCIVAHDFKAGRAPGLLWPCPTANDVA